MRDADCKLAGIVNYTWRCAAISMIKYVFALILTGIVNYMEMLCYWSDAIQ